MAEEKDTKTTAADNTANPAENKTTAETKTAAETKPADTKPDNNKPAAKPSGKRAASRMRNSIG